MSTTDITHVTAFLGCATPRAWLDHALRHVDVLLIDHAHCEKKAAATALNLMYRYPERDDLQHQLSRLAREELRHFEQVMELMQQRNVKFKAFKPSRYAASLREHVRKDEPGQFIDLMIISALIEARSCERFAAIAPELPDQALAQYYRFLLRSESRHFENYLTLARRYADGSIDARIADLVAVEAALIQGEDPLFRFHSGVPLKPETPHEGHSVPQNEVSS